MKIQLMLDLQGEFIKITNNKAKTITIATLRFCDKRVEINKKEKNYNHAFSALDYSKKRYIYASKF